MQQRKAAETGDPSIVSAYRRRGHGPLQLVKPATLGPRARLASGTWRLRVAQRRHPTQRRAGLCSRSLCPISGAAVREIYCSPCHKRWSVPKQVP